MSSPSAPSSPPTLVARMADVPQDGFISASTITRPRRIWSAGLLHRHRWRRTSTGFVALTALFAIALLHNSIWLVHPGGRGTVAVALVGAAGYDGGGGGSNDPEAFAAAVYRALDEVEPLAAQVQTGSLIRNFGEKAHSIIRNAVSKSPGSPAEVEGALDGVLHALFLQQLSLLRRQVQQDFERDHRLESAIRRADAQFVRSAQALVRPFSTWSFEADRAALRESLGGLLQREVRLQQEKSKAAHTSRATADVIGKLSKEMEALAESLKGSAAGGPMQVWTSYRVKGTPIQVTGKYQEGRANIEFNLVPDIDPGNAEAGFVEGFTRQNLGLSVNVGV